MRVLGIDPGSTVTGYGVVEASRGKLVRVASGTIKTSSKTPICDRLTAIHAGLVAVIEDHKPDVAAIEAIFRHKSSESAIRLGQARGVALLAIGQSGLEAHEYNPMQVKSTVGGSGRADKDGVARMVRLILGVLPDGPADETDALAIAITHHQHARFAAMVRRAG
jgi:crossover junction endodeoxyribonuclease RuvC